MAEKHKSKYKAPKDLEKSQKPKPRKDLKDYTHDDKKGALNPKSTGEKQSNVLRKTDKEMVDDGKYDVKYNADSRLYKDLEDGEYDPKHAAKVFKKRQDADEKDNEKNIQDKIENLTREGRERLVREYVRRKIQSVLREAEETETPADEAPTEEMPADVSTDTVAAPTEPTTPETAPADVTATEPTAAPAATPAPTDTTTPAPEATPEELENRAFKQAAQELSKTRGVVKLNGISKILKMSMNGVEPAEEADFYRLLRQLAIKKIAKLEPKINKK